MGIGVVRNLSAIPSDIDIRLTEDTAMLFTPRQLSANEINSYETAGFVFVPSLLQAEQARRLLKASEDASDGPKRITVTG